MSKATKTDKEIGAKIELHRKLRSKTRAELGEKIKKSYQTVQNYEEGRYRVAASCLYAISKALKYPIDRFFPSDKDCS